METDLENGWLNYHPKQINLEFQNLGDDFQSIDKIINYNYFDLIK